MTVCCCSTCLIWKRQLYANGDNTTSTAPIDTSSLPSKSTAMALLGAAAADWYNPFLRVIQNRYSRHPNFVFERIFCIFNMIASRHVQLHTKMQARNNMHTNTQILSRRSSCSPLWPAPRPWCPSHEQQRQSPQALGMCHFWIQPVPVRVAVWYLEGTWWCKKAYISKDRTQHFFCAGRRKVLRPTRSVHIVWMVPY